MIDDLLQIACGLAGAIGSGRPKAAALRRATSSAYYALFHALAKLCADELVGATKPWASFTPMYRSLDHRRARDTFIALRREKNGTPEALIATAFVARQDARHEADYNPEPFSLNRDGTLNLIGTAERAVKLLNDLPSQDKLALAVRLIARMR